ncbi:MAG TPA: heme ABC transporter ATP-binding protein [Chitinophagaceae bacterium]
MLSIKNISYSVGKKEIVKNISVDFLPGEFTMILGPNGSGKSTFLKLFSGELKAKEGAICYSDKKIAELKKEELAKVRAVMSQQPELGFPLRVEEVVMMGRYPHFTFNPGKKDENICNEVIMQMKIEELKHRNYLTLSGGEKQRVQFARVLAQIWDMPLRGHRYLFLDEPLTNLDINYQQEFLTIARSLTKTDTVLVAVMHDVNLAVQYADKLIFLKDGEMVSYGNPLDILSEDLIKKVFDVDTRIIQNPVNGLPLMVYDN